MSQEPASQADPTKPRLDQAKCSHRKRRLTFALALLLALLISRSDAVRAKDDHVPEVSSTFQHTGTVWAVAFSPDGKTLAAGAGAVGGPSEVWLWDLASRKRLLALKHGAGMGAVAFSHGGSRLACGYDDGQVFLWAVPAGAKEAVLASEEAVKSLSFSPDDRLLAVADADGKVTIWDVKRATLRRRLKASNDYAFAVAFSPDGRTLATGGDYNGSVKLWDTPTWQVARTLVGHSGAVDALAFSPDGRWLASGSWDDTAKLWDPATGDLVATMGGHSFNVWDVGFSPDGRLLATASEEVVMWRVPRGVRMLLLPDEDTMTVAFSPDGYTLATANDLDVHLWDIRRR